MDVNHPSPCIHISFAVVPGYGEDSFALHVDGEGGFLCVADGCGGPGAKRYESMGGRTGAHLAAKLATERVGDWVRQGFVRFPKTKSEAELLCESLSRRLADEMRNFEMVHARESGVRISGRMQRTLPTTICASLFQGATEDMLDLLFLWAGDSRGYLLDGQGLHQLTADHTAKGANALESLYSDGPLQNMINADTPFRVSARRIRVQNPCVVITATDGAYAYFPTPMEFEWLLLSTLKASASMAAWQKKLENILKKVASDDCTMLAAMIGYDDFEKLKQSMEERCNELQQLYITPVRRRSMRPDYMRDRWDHYRQGYDRMEGNRNDELDWRI